VRAYDPWLPENPWEIVSSSTIVAYGNIIYGLLNVTEGLEVVEGVGRIRFSFVVPNNSSVSSLRPNYNHSSSPSAVSSTLTSTHEAADYGTKRCATALESNLEEHCADLVVF